MESTRTYVVSIKLDNGESVKVHQVGHTHWEAIDRVYNKYHHVYPYNVSRSNYTASATTHLNNISFLDDIYGIGYK